MTEITYSRSGSDGSTDIKQTSNVCKLTLADLRELLEEPKEDKKQKIVNLWLVQLGKSSDLFVPENGSHQLTETPS